jgi:hypothetical protein
MADSEFGALTAFASMDNPANPPCSGPVVVHYDGSIECQAGCEGIAFAYHGPGATYGCDAIDGDFAHRCSRCGGDDLPPL